MRFPAEPNILSPALAEDADRATDAVVAGSDLVVRWEPVAVTIDGKPVAVVAYEVIITKEDHDDPDAMSRPVYDLHVPGGTVALSMPEEPFEPGAVYELEVLAVEENGNQTISLGFFGVADP